MKEKELNNKKEYPYVFIKWKDRKTVKKFKRKLIVKLKKLELLLKELISLSDVNKKKYLVFPIKKSLEKRFIFSIIKPLKKDLVFSINKKLEKYFNNRKDLVFLIKKLEKDLVFPINKKLEKYFNNRKDLVFSKKQLEQYLFLLINRLKQAGKAYIVSYYRFIVLSRIATSRFFDSLDKSEKFNLGLIWCWVFEFFFKYSTIGQKMNLEFQIQTNRIDEKKRNFFKESTNEVSLKGIFLDKFLIVENSYLILLKNKLLFKKKTNAYMFFKFCYFLKIQLFNLLIKGKRLFSNVSFKLKSLFKFAPFIFNSNKLLQPVKNKSKKIPFNYRYNYLLSKVCNYFRYVYFKKRWEKKIQTQQNHTFIFKSYGCYTNLVTLPKPIFYDK